MMTPGCLRVLMAALATTAWMFVSSVLIVLNKHLMVDLHFAYPMTVSGMGMLASSLLSYGACRCNLVEVRTVITFDFWVRRMLPVGFFMGLSLWSGNLVYLHLTVAFIQMLKAFTPVITMVCLFMARLEDPTPKMIMSVLLTAGGTAMAAYGELNLSILGLAYMFTSETGEAIRLVMTQYLLNGLKFHPIEGLMYLAPACCLWLTLGAVFIEFPKIMASGAASIFMHHPMQFMLAAVMGFMVNTLAYTSIKLASSLTLKVLGTVKNTLLVLFSMIFMGEMVTALQSAGYAVSLAGFAWYNQIKMNQIASHTEPKSLKGGPP